MAKRTFISVLTRNQQGQISIFFSASIMVLISIIAFVINVGLFVKAKINLQNATDAAAYAGASVQARQLTKMAYLNWEMRNVFKEWMYKYYVVGNLNIKDVETKPNSEKMSFRLDKDVNVLSGKSSSDPYNIPAVCIHLAGSQTNICKRYAIPGLPEFGGYSLPGSEEASRSFIDSLIATKVTNCIDRTKLNMLVATTWAYNVLSSDMDKSLIGQGPAIMADRQGAWPKAIELAIRMRNLEYAMNRPAETDGVCKQQSSGSIKCKTLIDDLTTRNLLGNERISKAFYSGFRNIGGSHSDDEMKRTFTLKEISPKIPDLGNERSASHLLIPNSSQIQKPFVDLKLMMVNYSIFYAAMIPRGNGDTSGACDVSKVALPVPGYPLGFYKNPDVVTYYAVKGEAEFVGMFNPFNSDAIKLTAYSAAKPFGGRIGPMLFTQREGKDFFTGRTDSNKLRSIPYFTTLDVVGTPSKEDGRPLRKGEYTTGAPLPINGDKSFWLEDEDQALGGIINSGEGVQFGIPNLVYDFLDGSMTATSYSAGGNKIHKIIPKDGLSNDQAVGLFNADQFHAFKGNISGSVTPEDMAREISRVRAPTSYEAANYLIPTPVEFNLKNDMDSFGFISGQGRPIEGSLQGYEANIYAPLFRSNDQEDVLYKSADEVLSGIFQFMRQQESGILKYVTALNQGAFAIYKMKDRVSAGAVGTIPQYKSAAEGVSDITDLDGNLETQMPKSCKSLAGLFLNYYYGDGDLKPNLVSDTRLCPPNNLGLLLRQYFSPGSAYLNPTHYKMDYSFDPKNFAGSPRKELSVFSAYMPGPFTGVNDDGHFASPFAGSSIAENMRRNFYSTKFVPLNSLRSGSSRSFQESSTNFVIYSEGDIQTQAGFDRSQNALKNELDQNSADVDLNSIKY